MNKKPTGNSSRRFLCVGKCKLRDEIIMRKEKQKTKKTVFKNRHFCGRGGGTRTPGTRFWRPLLYQLSYTPKFCCPTIIP